MSAVLVTMAVGSALAVYQQNRSKNIMAEEEAKPEIAQRENLSSGTYGEMAEIGNCIKEPGFIVGEKIGQDLMGMPCRWLYAKNGGAYRTYDLQTKYI